MGSKQLLKRCMGRILGSELAAGFWGCHKHGEAPLSGLVSVPLYSSCTLCSSDLRKVQSLGPCHPLGGHIFQTPVHPAARSVWTSRQGVSGVLELPSSAFCSGGTQGSISGDMADPDGTFRRALPALGSPVRGPYHPLQRRADPQPSLRRPCENRQSHLAPTVSPHPK